MCRAFIAGICLVLMFASPQNAIGKEIPLPAAEAYKKAVSVLEKMGMMLTYRDEGNMIIKTDANLAALTEKECDCGSRFGIPFINDRKTKTVVSYQVQFGQIDDRKCDMDLKIHIDGYMDVYDGEFNVMEKSDHSGKKLICRSTGVLEKRFEELLLK